MMDYKRMTVRDENGDVKFTSGINTNTGFMVSLPEGEVNALYEALNRLCEFEEKNV